MNRDLGQRRLTQVPRALVSAVPAYALAFDPDVLLVTGYATVRATRAS